MGLPKKNEAKVDLKSQQNKSMEREVHSISMFRGDRDRFDEQFWNYQMKHKKSGEKPPTRAHYIRHLLDLDK